MELTIGSWLSLAMVAEVMPVFGCYGFRDKGLGILVLRLALVAGVVQNCNDLWKVGRLLGGSTSTAAGCRVQGLV